MPNSVEYAASNSKGALANLIGWIDYGDSLDLLPGGSAFIENMIPGGYTISFNLYLEQTYDGAVGDPVAFQGFTTPVLGSNTVAFGNTGYTGINGNVALYMSNESANLVMTTSKITMSDISVVDSYNNPVESFVIIAADVETTNKVETWSVTTNGTVWNLLDNLPAPYGGTSGGPTISGIGTDIVNETGKEVDMGAVSGPVYITENPTQIITSVMTSSSRQGIAFGVIVQNKQLYSCFQGRINIGNCCCNNQTQAYSEIKVQERYNNIAIKDLRINVSGTIGDQPFNGTVIGAYSGIPTSPIIYFSDIVLLGQSTSSTFTPNLGFPSAFNFINKVCLPTMKNMMMIDCLNSCLSIDCIRPVNKEYSIFTDPTYFQEPKGTNACFLVDMDLSLILNKITNYVSREQTVVACACDSKKEIPCNIADTSKENS